MVGHEERCAGESKYSLDKLIRLNFDLITGFTLAPLQYFTMFAGLCAIGSFLMVLVLAYRRIFLGAEAEVPRPAALRRSGLRFVYIEIAVHTAAKRVEARSGHLFPTAP